LCQHRFRTESRRAAKKQLLLLIALQKKEIETLKRSLGFQHRRIRFSSRLRRFYALLIALLPKIKDRFSIITPETVLKWYHALLKSFWTFPARNRKLGRPPVSIEVRNLILQMKNDNLLWGIKRIQGELSLKLGISLDKKTISSILQDFRRKGKIKSGTTWSQFIKMHFQSLFACDFFTVDTLFNKRFFVFFVIHLATRKIKHWSVTLHPSYQFVRQRLITFSEKRPEEKTYLIHDNSPELDQNYEAFNITGVATSIGAPNMNAYAERFVRSIRREALDRFIIVNEKQLNNIVLRYVAIITHSGRIRALASALRMATRPRFRERSSPGRSSPGCITIITGFPRKTVSPLASPFGS
jgi:putative transposase